MASVNIFSLNNSSDAREVSVMDDGTYAYFGIGTRTPTHPLEVVVDGSILFSIGTDGKVTGAIPAQGSYSFTGTAPASILGAGTSAGTFWSIVAPNGGASSGAAGGKGGELSFTTGNGGASVSGGAAGGDFYINCGTSTGTQRGGDIKITAGSISGTPTILTTINADPYATSGNPGAFIVNIPYAPMNNYGSSGIGVLTANAYGLRIGGLADYTSAYQAFGIFVTYTDPPGVGGTGLGGLGNAMGEQNLVTINTTADNHQIIGSQQNSIRTQIGSPWAYHIMEGVESEPWVQGSGLVDTVHAFSFYPQTAAASSSNVTAMVGVYGQIWHRGTGTIATATGVDVYLTMSPSGGAVDGNVTTYYGFASQVQNLSTAATPGVLSTDIGFWKRSPALAATGTPSIGQNIGFQCDVMFNTYNHTSTTGGYNNICALFTPSNQGGNTSGTNFHYGLQVLAGGATPGTNGSCTNIAAFLNVPNGNGGGGSGFSANYAIRISGNGGTPSGTLVNWALYSSSTASSSILGTLVLGSNSSPQGTTSASSILIATPTATVVSAAGAIWNGISVPATTATISGSTGITTATGFNLATIAGPVLSGAGLAVTNAATLALLGPPTVTGGMTLTHPYSLWSQSGANRFDGDSIHVGTATTMVVGFNYLPANAGAPTGVPTNAASASVPMCYDYTNHFLYVYDGTWKKSTVYA